MLLGKCHFSLVFKSCFSESSNFFVSSGCGFYDSSGTACCRANGAGNNCVPNAGGPNGRNRDQCSPDHFGGIPSANGGGDSDICNGNEVFGGDSCLMAPVNSDCICIPSATELCKTPTDNKVSPDEARVVCRAKDMTDAVLDTDSCGQCRKCMQDECAAEIGAGEPNDWSDEAAVVATLNAWNDLDCRTALATECTAVCAF